MDFTLTQGQEAAMKMISELLAAPAPAVGILTGYAGTGKSTLLQVVCSQFGWPTMLAPTGKAAIRIRETTGAYASTIHKWLYEAREDEKTGDTYFARKHHDLIDTPLNGFVVIDEASMLGRTIWEDIIEICRIKRLHVLLVGDPFQLPPVEGKVDGQPFSALTQIETPFRAHLDEVTRQALNSPIFRASMKLRKGVFIGEVLDDLNRVYTRNFDDTCLSVYNNGGVVIVHRNTTRHQTNGKMRAALGHKTNRLDVGEPLLVTKNNYDIDRFNGEVIEFQKWVQEADHPFVVANRYKNIQKSLDFGIAMVDDQEVMISPDQIHGESELGEKSIQGASRRAFKTTFSLDHDDYCIGRVVHDKLTHLHANFGYCLTAHKSQGSEWQEGIVLIEDSVRINTYEGRRWAYTAFTRFKDKCYYTLEV